MKNCNKRGYIRQLVFLGFFEVISLANFFIQPFLQKLRSSRGTSAYTDFLSSGFRIKDGMKNQGTKINSLKY